MNFYALCFPYTRLGQRLLQQQAVNIQQLHTALEHQKKTADRLGAVLLRLGHIEESTLHKALTWQRQQRCLTQLPHLLKRLFQRETPVEAKATPALPQQEQLLDIVNHYAQRQQPTEQSHQDILTLLLSAIHSNQAHIEGLNIEYEPGPQLTLAADGTLNVQLPSHIGELRVCNVKIMGNEGIYYGDLILNNLRFSSQTQAKLLLHPDAKSQ